MYIYPHKNEWKAEYLNESKLILASYGECIELHHIGSTAIEGLFAKDCIDILGIVEHLPDVKNRYKAITDLGYHHKGEHGISGREYFSKNARKVHLHIFQAGDSNIRKHLHFVEVMIRNSQLVEELNELKKHLHHIYPSDRESYQREKEYFYNNIHALL